MEQTKSQTPSICGRLLLCLSTLFGLGLFYTPSTLWALFLAGILTLTVFYQLLHIKESFHRPTWQCGSLILSVTIVSIGLLLFLNKGKELFNASLFFTLAAGIVLAVLGFFSFYMFSLWMEENLCRVLNLPLQNTGSFPISNLIFPLSALGFFLLESRWTPEIRVSLLAAVALSLVIAIHGPELLALKREKSTIFLSLLTALGIAFFRVSEASLGCFGWAAGFLSLPFLYICLSVFYHWLFDLFSRLEIGKDVSHFEKIFYLILILSAFLFTALVFFHTDAFYGTTHEFDVIYTSDSPKLVGTNAYLSLRHQENDLRQPLFAVFAAPFLGLSYLVASILPSLTPFVPLMMDWAQILLLLLTHFMLARMLKLSSNGRILFMAAVSLSYPTLLFLFMMEQYIVVYFWLILCISLLLDKQPQAELSLCGTGGTLLTGLILMPALGGCNAFHNFKSWFLKMLTLCLSFLLVLLLFGRLDIVLNAPTQLLTMLQFSGKKLTTLQKLTQYSGFFSQCILAPGAGADLETLGYPSWQLFLPSGFSIAGLTVLGLCILSAFLNRKDAVSRAAILWLGFSFLILFVLGWGTAENGLILYSLYFGWAIWVLLYRLLQKLKTHSTLVFHVTAAAAVLLLAAVNLPAIYKLIQFACLYYPI